MHLEDKKIKPWMHRKRQKEFLRKKLTMAYHVTLNWQRPNS
jgi:hypothetical protein